MQKGYIAPTDLKFGLIGIPHIQEASHTSMDEASWEWVHAIQWTVMVTLTRICNICTNAIIKVVKICTPYFILETNFPEGTLSYEGGRDTFQCYACYTGQ